MESVLSIPRLIVLTIGITLSLIALTLAHISNIEAQALVNDAAQQLADDLVSAGCGSPSTAGGRVVEPGEVIPGEIRIPNGNEDPATAALITAQLAVERRFASNPTLFGASGRSEPPPVTIKPIPGVVCGFRLRAEMSAPILRSRVTNPFGILRTQSAEVCINPTAVPAIAPCESADEIETTPEVVDTEDSVGCVLTDDMEQELLSQVGWASEVVPNFPKDKLPPYFLIGPEHSKAGAGGKPIRVIVSPEPVVGAGGCQWDIVQVFTSIEPLPLWSVGKSTAGLGRVVGADKEYGYVSDPERVSWAAVWWNELWNADYYTESRDNPRDDPKFSTIEKSLMAGRRVLEERNGDLSDFAVSGRCPGNVDDSFTPAGCLIETPDVAMALEQQHKDWLETKEGQILISAVSVRPVVSEYLFWPVHWTTLITVVGGDSTTTESFVTDSRTELLHNHGRF